jgi:hypothetical protein
VFDNGRIVEDGSHAQLLAQGGPYQRLWSRQAGGFVLDDGAAAKEGLPVEEDEELTESGQTPEEVIGQDRRTQRRIADRRFP